VTGQVLPSVLPSALLAYRGVMRANQAD